MYMKIIENGFNNGCYNFRSLKDNVMPHSSNYIIPTYNVYNVYMHNIIAINVIQL